MAESETIADIIAEKRQQADKIERNCAEMMKRGKMISDSFVRELVADIRREANRLEAAQKREAGDAAKLREALKAIGGLCAGLMPTWDGAVGRIKDMAETALAAPPRNCDRFATVDEARKAHEAICEKYDECRHCPLNNEEHYCAFDCFEAWLFAPSTEAEGGAK